MELNASHSGYWNWPPNKRHWPRGNVAFRFWLVGVSLVFIGAAIFDWRKKTREMHL